jgi:hypothetical protein
MRHWTKQEIIFDGTTVTPLPVIKKKRSIEEEENEATTIINKRHRNSVGDQSEYIPNFYQAMRNMLKNQISNIIINSDKKKKKNKPIDDLLKELKEKGINDIRFPEVLLQMYQNFLTVSLQFSSSIWMPIFQQETIYLGIILLKRTLMI